MVKSRQEQGDELTAMAAAQDDESKELSETIDELASGTLTIEAWSALALALGVVLTMFGSLCSIY